MPSKGLNTAAAKRRPGLTRLGGAAPDAVLTASLAATAALALLTFIAGLFVWAGTYGYAAWVEDDFFYYAVIAGQIVESGRSSFDGVTLTNGYHPLWMLVCVAVGAVFEVHTYAFFVTIFLIQAALVLGGVVAICTLTARMARAGLMTHSGRMIVGVVYGLAFAVMGLHGMEVALLAPLMPLLLIYVWKVCEQPSLRAASLAVGLLCACILSRLDTIVLFAPLCLGAAIWTLRREGIAGTLKLAPAALALAPFGVYLVFNHLAFGAAMPLSGAAKRLTVEGAPFGPSMLSLSSFILTPNANFLFVPTGATLAAIAGLVAVAALRPLRMTLAGAGFLLLGFGALIYYLQAALTSDWMLWLWYFFPIVLLGALSSGIVFDRIANLAPAGHTANRWPPLVLAAALTLALLRINAWTLTTPQSESNALFARAVPVLEFAKSHPGRYAMGNGAGVVGFFLPQSLAQLEGLVNDQTLLDEIQAQGSLAKSLKRQKIDYYITGHSMPLPECVTMREPADAGPKAPVMSERVCETPVFTNQTGWLPMQIYDVRDGLN